MMITGENYARFGYVKTAKGQYTPEIRHYYHDLPSDRKLVGEKFIRYIEGLTTVESAAARIPPPPPESEVA